MLRLAFAPAPLAAAAPLAAGLALADAGAEAAGLALAAAGALAATEAAGLLAAGLGGALLTGTAPPPQAARPKSKPVVVGMSQLDNRMFVYSFNFGVRKPA